MGSSHSPDNGPGRTQKLIHFPHPLPWRGRKGGMWQTSQWRSHVDEQKAGKNPALGIKNDHKPQSGCCKSWRLVCVDSACYSMSAGTWMSSFWSLNSGKEKNTSILKAFYNSTRLQPGFGELHPVIANCCRGNTASHYWRSSDCWSNLRGHRILTFREANLGGGRKVMLSAALQNKSEQQSWNWSRGFDLQKSLAGCG